MFLSIRYFGIGQEKDSGEIKNLNKTSCSLSDAINEPQHMMPVNDIVLVFITV